MSELAVTWDALRTWTEAQPDGVIGQANGWNSCPVVRFLNEATGDVWSATRTALINESKKEVHGHPYWLSEVIRLVDGDLHPCSDETRPISNQEFLAILNQCKPVVSGED